ncbi:preprotein translocase subunit SecA [Wohlfahrtiimonas sp. G9077]|uniref:preprotein translocase subunit SecA n=1 Tax=Wohlfahrtiimonas sp. G9077 TaxID=1980118 RepID=UPI000B9960D4|nr:preprotein translocase subunit SecA [Wohlfahrtiimonas sp. G9077]OYQ73451.1 preprotein translocase subunit SecA [Wohlfahrtiimonas sp. G9077]
MFGAIAKKIFGTRNDRLVKEAQKTVKVINALEPTMQAMTDEELQQQTIKFRERIQNGESLNKLLPEAFATLREASSRVMGMRHYDVQMIGGIVLHQGKIAEMRTGEGKTLVATLAVYLNALEGKGVHVVTVNDYLAKRDAAWMGKLYRWMGLSVGVVVSDQAPDEKKSAYEADITYCTNNEIGFDYLRDNMSFDPEHKVQRPLNFAVIDEVDSILIDEARTPLIISGPAEGSEDLYKAINEIVPYLKKADANGDNDFTINEKDRQVLLTEVGHEHAENLLVEAGLLKAGESLYDANNLKLYHHLDSCLRAHHLFRRDVEYLIKNNEIIIVDEHTGRTLAGRRWSDGLHQAIEAKEGVPIKPENQTLASITFQNLFRIYKKLSGMTGTADTEAPELLEIYGLEVVVIPTNKAIQRKDYGDLIFLTQREKYEAIIKDIEACREAGQPVLVGTASVEVSELLAEMLKARGIHHEVLNAKQHEREAYIVGAAGKPGAVTIATNMAGRGTDIVLGGNFEMEMEAYPDATAAERAAMKAEWQKRHDDVLAKGGLHIIGTERHESRRIDNQLRGRAGRQGDVGSSRFYLSLEDNLMRIFTSPSAYNMMKKLGMGDGIPLEHKWISRSIENAQRKVEGHNFEIRKNLLQYDNVANDQRKVIYQQRDDILAASDVGPAIDAIRETVFRELVAKHIPPQSFPEQWDMEGLEAKLSRDFMMDVKLEDWLKEDDTLEYEGVVARLIEMNQKAYRNKQYITLPDTGEEISIVDQENFKAFEKNVLLQLLDRNWKDHLAAMDYLRQGIQLRAYAQKRPEQEYKREAFEMFEMMLDRIYYETIGFLSRLTIELPKVTEEDAKAIEALKNTDEETEVLMQRSFSDAGVSNEVQAPEQNNVMDALGLDFSAVGRNDECPCGSGKKYKHCHGKI